MDKEHQEVSTKLIKITLMSLTFMGIELLGGYLANSIAIFADAFHLLSDVLAYLISLLAVWLSTRPNSPRYLGFGWEKAEPLGALINVVVIYIVTVELFMEATHRMINRQIVEEPKYMLITSIFGLICNIIIMGILHSDPHGGHQGCSHSHGHSHDSHDHTHQLDHETHDHGSHEHLEHEHHEHCNHSHQHKQHAEHEHHNQQDESNSGKQFILAQACISEQISHSHNDSHHVHSNCSHHHHPHDHHDHHHQHGSPKNVEKHEECGLQNIQRHSGDQLASKELSKPKDQIDDDLIKSPHSQDHPHNHEEDDHKEEHNHKKIKNINLQAAYIHILTDIILSIGVIVSALIIYFVSPDHHHWTPWQLADPLCTYLFSFLAIWSTWPILKEAILLLLDSFHKHEMVQEIQKKIKALPQIKELKELRMWSTNRNKHYAAVRVQLNDECGLWQVKQILSSRKVNGFVEVVVELNEEVSLEEH